MKGLVLAGKGRVEWRDCSLPELGPRDAIIRTKAACPCTTDVHSVEAFPFPKMQGIVLGHEAVGVVEQIGGQVRDFKPGDRVLVPSVTPEWDALEVQDGLSKFANGSGYLFTKKKNGVFAERFHVNDADRNLAHIPDSVSDLEAVLCADMLPTACAGVEAAELRFGDSVVVLGIGPVGLLSVAAAKLRGAGCIYAVGTRKNCAQLALQYGASAVFSYRETGWDQTIVAANGGPLDAAIVAGGSTASIGMALGMVKKGGMVSNVAGFVEEPETVLPNDKWFLGTSDKTIKGTMVPGGRRYMERMLSLVVNGRVDVKPLAAPVLHGLPALEEAMRLMTEKPEGLIKPVVLID